MSDQLLRPRKQPRQARSRATVEVILEAATRVLAQSALSGFNTNKVAEVAGISVGSLYQYFPNKAALMSALIERAHMDLADAFRTLMRRTAGWPLREALEAIADLAVDQQYGDPLLAAALDHEEKRLPLQGLLAQADQALLDAVKTFLLRYEAQFSVTSIDVAAHDCLVITRAMVEADVERGNVPSADLRQRITRALLGYLTIQAKALQL